MWPLMVVDIVFFQREVFLFSQEAVMLYRPRRDYLRRRPFHFDYMTLGVLVAKVMEPFVIRQTKTVIGVAGHFLFRRGIRFIRGPMQVAMRQGFKWCGVVVTREMVEGGHRHDGHPAVRRHRGTRVVLAVHADVAGDQARARGRSVRRAGLTARRPDDSRILVPRWG